MGAQSDIESKHAPVVDTASSDVDTATGTVIDSTKPHGQTQRGLNSRHVQLMAVGGSIGTGLFVGIGSALRTAGPLSLLLAFVIYPLLLIYPCCMAVAEMATHLPIRGGIYEFAHRYVDPAFGFALGWTYFYGACMLFCAELSAVATVMGYWDVNVNPAVWVLMALVVCIALNVYAVKWYGESEFIFSCTKILLLVGLVLLTFITMVGGNPQHDAYGFRHWKNGDAMHAYYTTGTTGRFCGWWSCVVYAAFAIGGPEFIALAAGEIRDPRRNIPSCARAVFGRIVGFYVFGVLAVGIICSSRDERLLGAIDGGSVGSAASPFVIGISNLGISGLAGLINVLILLSGWSCGNAYMFSASRTLYSLALDGHAPKVFTYCTAAGCPIVCIAAVSLISCITFLVADSGAAEVFGWFVDLATCGFVLSYTGWLCTWVGWNRALKAQGIARDSLHWKAPFMPYMAYIGIGTGCCVLLFLGFDAFVPFSVQSFVTGYFAIAWATACFVFWKLFKKTAFVKPEEADLWSGKESVDAECKTWEDRAAEPLSRWARVWSKLW